MPPMSNVLISAPDAIRKVLKEINAEHLIDRDQFVNLEKFVHDRISLPPEQEARSIPRLWGIPIVESDALPPGSEVLFGDFSLRTVADLRIRCQCCGIGGPVEEGYSALCDCMNLSGPGRFCSDCKKCKLHHRGDFGLCQKPAFVQDVVITRKRVRESRGQSE